LVTHVHGAHVQPESDGYPESWWLPGAPGTKGIPASYAERGSDFTQANDLNTIPGSAYYSYENTQPATTLWYHDHALGMTRLNVYAGPAGFWLIRGGANGDALIDDFSTGPAADGILPGPAPSTTAGDPNFDPAVRSTIREIPIAIQDRSFNTDGSLFYPTERSFFDGFTGPYIGGVDPPVGPSDISGIWNPEAFFNTMVVNGTTWPRFEVAQGRYRLRLLNGCNARTLNLSLFVVSTLGADGLAGTNDDLLDPLHEIPFYQIGAEQGFLPKVVKITTGFATPLPGKGTLPAAMGAADGSEALLMGPAERADVIVDFSTLANNTRIRMINTAPDAPFGKLPDDQADPLTTGQVMDFIVNTTLNLPADEATTLPENLVLPAEAPLGPVTNTRQLSLNELSSNQICVEIDHETEEIVGTLFSVAPSDPGYATFLADCQAATPVNPENETEPMGPRQALLGVMTKDGQGNLTGSTPLMWSEPITETPLLNDTEVWEIFNTTVDAHPIHLHLVRFEVLDRQKFDEDTFKPVAGTLTSARPNEAGYKDTVLAYPGQITRVKAKFDIAGLYVWHCHIVEHEDNEMMRPYIVAASTTLTLNTGWNLVSSTIAIPAATFGAGSKFASLWKWGGKNWSVYLPGEMSTGAYATSKGFDQLGTIDPGEGFWVDVNSAGGETITLTGTPVSGQLSFAKGWNLKGLMGATPLTVAEISMGQPVLNSIWKWENDNWSVYLTGEASPGTYANAHGFGQLTTINPGEGFWVHRP
jgi:FtsP/CotA-like multicopper oxidase with cupredoxin domain